MKTFQVLLPNWLEKYVKHRADLLDISFSEVIRLQICYTILFFQKPLFPEYKSDFSYKDVLKIIGKKNKKRDEILEFVSRVYFEARKASDYQFKNIDRFKKLVEWIFLFQPFSPN